MSGYVRSNALKSYGRVANVETNPLRGVVMLYDGAIKFLQMAAHDIDAKDIVAKAEHTDRALAIVTYLQSILDFERGGEASVVYDRLFTSVSSMILRASVKLDAGVMREAADLLSPVRDAWATIAAAAEVGPVPQSAASQTVALEAR